MEKKYVIRFQHRKESEPLTEAQVKDLILMGEISENVEVSIYPNQFAIAIKNYPEFDSLFDDENKTRIIETRNQLKSTHEEKTSVKIAKPTEVNTSSYSSLSGKKHLDNDISEETKNEPTRVIEIPINEKVNNNLKSKRKLPKKSLLVLMLLLLVVFDFLEEEEEKESFEKQKIVMVPIRPQLPTASGIQPDPINSEKAYQLGLKPYFEDTVSGYRKAVNYFQLALKYDGENVSALALLASSYLNLIESSNQDEKTFSVISKLIELSKSKQATTVEVLIAEVEFLANSKRYDAGIQKLVEYSKTAGKIDASLYYYIAWLHYLKNENSNALRYLNLIPASALPMAKLYYLRGVLLEETQEFDEAISEYKRALQLNPKHARSILALVRIAEKKGDLKSSKKMIQFLSENPSLQSPAEYIQTLIFRSKLALLLDRQSEAALSLKKALSLNPRNEELRLEYYSLLSLNTSDSKYKNLAQMFSLVLEAEKLSREGMTHEAIAVLIRAKDTFPKSEVPVEKMGDLFFRLGDFNKAASNYKSAIQINPESTHISVKLIESLIRNHEWDEAQKYLIKYRTVPSLKSSIDRLAGNLAAQQGNYKQAVDFYRKAMARDSVDIDVYVSYGDILREFDQCKDAQFFYSVAQKFDPLNFGALLGSAKCLLKTDGVAPAITRIQDELRKLPKKRADYVAGIAEIYSISGDFDKGMQFADQAIEIDSAYPESYRIKGELLKKKQQITKENRMKMLDYFKAYSDRKHSDPSGYIQRFDLFLEDSRFDQATEELNRVFEVSPRFPELHFRRARLYSKMGRVKDAIDEMEEELKINPNMVKALDEKGNLLLKLNRLDEAMKSFVRSMEVNPQNPTSKMGAGYIHYLKRQFPSAIALYSAALMLDKGNPEIYKKLGLAYRESGDSEKAAQFFRNYLDLAPDAVDREDYEKYRQ